MLRSIALGLLGIMLLAFPSSATDPDEVKVARLAEEFGQRLKHVSLLAPAEVVAESMRRQNGEYVTPELLEEWVHNPGSAPGRRASSPWPERIEVIRITRGAGNTYQVDGAIVEVTSSGEAARRAVALTVEKRDGTWRISAVHWPPEPN